MQSFSQLGQDLAVLKYYNNKRNGYFVEAGASDGLDLSNTYLLEKEFGRSGICVEPIPEIFKRLVVNRPNSKCFQIPLFSEAEKDVVFSIAGYTLVSGITDFIGDKWKERIGSGKKDITTKTDTLMNILDKANAPKFIEYLSLDTEGTEFEILKNFDFSKYKFGLVDIEHNNIEPTRTHIRELLLKNGYTYIGENRWDDCYKFSIS